MKQETLNKNKNLPERIFRAGAISATIWSNPKTINGKDVNIKSVVIERNYKDKDGNWQKTSQFGVSDLPKVSLVASQSFEYIVGVHSDE